MTEWFEAKERTDAEHRDAMDDMRGEHANMLKNQNNSHKHENQERENRHASDIQDRIDRYNELEIRLTSEMESLRQERNTTHQCEADHLCVTIGTNETKIYTLKVRV